MLGQAQRMFRTGGPFLALARRETADILRGWRGFFAAAIFLASAITVTLFMWPETNMLLSEVPEVSTKLSRGLSTTLLIFAALAVPGLAAVSVVSERENGTLDMLLASLVEADEIVMAKLVGVTALMLLLCAAALPVGASIMFLVGVDWEEIVVGLLVAVVLTVELGLIGIFVSALAGKSSAAVVWAYLLAAAVNGAVFMMALYLSGAMWSTLGSGPEILVPFLAAAPFLFWSLSKRALKGNWGHERFLGALLGERKKKERGRFEKARALFAGPKNKPKPAIKDGANPVLHKELWWGILSSPGARVALFLLALPAYSYVLAEVYISGSWASADTLPYQVVTIHILLALAVMPALMAISLSRDISAQNMDMMRMTIIDGEQFVRGKISSGFFLALPLLTASAIVYVPLGLVKECNLVTMCNLIACYLSFALSIAISAAISLFASIARPNTGYSLALGYALNAAIFVGVAVLCAKFPGIMTMGGILEEFVWTPLGASFGWFPGSTTAINFLWLVAHFSLHVLLAIIFMRQIGKMWDRQSLEG